ncbi:AAA family ATPase [Streptomyces cacaoi]|uniref:AAA family ATPase n=1 Tax=Streptomyces cacaoi TaxID=1898 RepID=UPI00339DBBDD
MAVPALHAGRVTIVEGDPGDGKSTMICDLAARFSAGRPMPDGSLAEAGTVLFLTAEDGVEDTIAPVSRRPRGHGARHGTDRGQRGGRVRSGPHPPRRADRRPAAPLSRHPGRGRAHGRHRPPDGRSLPGSTLTTIRACAAPCTRSPSQQSTLGQGSSSCAT